MTQVFAQLKAPPKPWLLGGWPESASTLELSVAATVVYADGTASDTLPAHTLAAVLGGGTTFDRTSATWLAYITRGAGTLKVCREADLGTLTGTFAILALVTPHEVLPYPQASGIGGGGGGSSFQWVTKTASYTITGSDSGILVDASAITTAPAAPTVSAVTGTSPGAGAWTVGLTYVTASGETNVVNTAAPLTVTNVQAVHVAALSGIPAGVTAVRYYMSIAAGSATLGYVTVQTVSGSAVPAIDLTVHGTTAPPASNTSGAIVITLPTAVGVTTPFAIKRIDTQYPANPVTIATTSAQTIDGFTNAVLTLKNHGYLLGSDNANWWIESAYAPNPLAALGDMAVGDTNAVPARLAVGVNTKRVTANSAATLGVDYET